MNTGAPEVAIDQDGAAPALSECQRQVDGRSRLAFAWAGTCHCDELQRFLSPHERHIRPECPIRLYDGLVRVEVVDCYERPSVPARPWSEFGIVRDCTEHGYPQHPLDVRRTLDCLIQILEEKCAGESQQQSYENAEYDSLAQTGANAERRRSAVENLDVWSDGRFLHASLLILLQQVAVRLIEDVGFESQLADLRFHPGEFQ